MVSQYPSGITPLKDLYVYVAGPLTLGDTFDHVRKAIEAGEMLWNNGFVPFVPHSMTAWAIHTQKSWEEWLEYDEKWLAKCDAVYLLPGTSRGAERERAFAAKHSIPIFQSIYSLIKWSDKKRLGELNDQRPESSEEKERDSPIS